MGGQFDLASRMETHPGWPAQFDQQFHRRGASRKFDLDEGWCRWSFVPPLPPAAERGVVEIMLAGKGRGG
jgi:hypothetical protein